MIVCGLLAYLKLGGLSGAHVVFPNYPWFSLFGRGVGADLAAGFSMAVGILVTQIYVQAILSGRSLRAARGGACLAALFTIPIGLLGVAVGLFMKAHFPKTPSAAVLPTFIMNFMPPVVAGIFIAALLISIVGSWAGLTLGVSTMLTRDIYKKFIRPASTDRETLLVLRLVIFVLCAIVCLTTYGNTGSLIMAWGFLSFGLRTCVVLIPMLAAMYCKRWITPAAGVAAVLCGPLLNIVWKLAFPKGMDPVYPGLIGAFAALVVVSFVTQKYPLKATAAHSAK
jgi:SSS family solute:Na+ symporter